MSKFLKEIRNDFEKRKQDISEMDEVDAADHVVCVFGGKYIQAENMPEPERGPGVDTYFNVFGSIDIFGEGLYSIVMSQVDNGDMSLFSLLRDIVRDIETAHEINPDESLEEISIGPTLH